jgi:hypothetical protein
MTRPASQQPVPRAVQQQPVKDPLIERGRYRVLQRTDGAWIVYDPERLPGQRTVGQPYKGDGAQDKATKFAEVLAAQDAKAAAP